MYKKNGEVGGVRFCVHHLASLDATHGTTAFFSSAPFYPLDLAWDSIGKEV